MLDRYGEETPDYFDAFAVAECDLCDENGQRGMFLCDHVDHAGAAKRGMAMIRRAMGWER